MIALFFIIFQLFLTNSIFSNDTQKIDFIYVDSNTGQSSGGHTGLKIGEYLYHFQFYDDKIFHLERENWNEFIYQYNSLDNRNIHKREFILDWENFEKISSYWNEFYLIQQRQLSILDYLKKDILFLESLKTNREIDISGLGYFTNNYDSKINLFNLKQNEKVFIDSQLNSINSKFLGLSYTESREIVLSKIKYLPKKNIFSQSIEDLLQSKIALFCITNRCELEKNSFFNLDSYLSTNEKNRILLKWRKNLPLLRNSILNQINEPNNKNLLITVIRYYYIKQSIETDSILIPDCFPSDSQVIKIENNREKFYSEFKNSVKILFEKGKNKFLASESFSEEELLIFEDTSNRYNEIFINRNNGNLRVHSKILFPSKEKKILLNNYLVINEEIDININKAKHIYETYYKDIKNLYPFDLIKENCTTEIFTTLNRLNNNNPIESIHLLGGYIPNNYNFSFIPFIADIKVGRYYKTKPKVEISSFRIRTKEKLKQDIPSLWVEIKESNTITSSIYEYNKNDSFFIFFTDDTILFRPLAGSINLTAGIGQIFIGVLTLPFDYGINIKKGIEGSLFSLPELFFFNIRKGSFISSKEYEKIFFDEDNK